MVWLLTYHKNDAETLATRTFDPTTENFLFGFAPPGVFKETAKYIPFLRAIDLS
jgi:hypothetical protein